MTWGVVIDVPAPIEMYDAVHAEIRRRVGQAVDGLLVHLSRPTEGGFQVIEVWESREDFAHYDTDIVGPIAAELSGSGPPDSAAQEVTEFEVRGLVIPPGGIFR